MEIIKKPVIINKPVKCGNTEIGVEEDIIVPDIKPDILKILQIDGKAAVTDTELSEGRLDIFGKVDINILYAPDREDERIKCIETSFDFSNRIDKNDIYPDMQVSVEADIEKIDFQVLNSRKIRIKAVVGISYEVSEQASIELATGVAESENAEVCIMPIELTSLVDVKHSQISIREELELQTGQMPIEEILKTDIKISNVDYKIVTERTVIKGILNLNTLYLDTNGSIRYCDFECPFTEIFELAEADEETRCDISFCVKEMECSLLPNSDGDMKRISLDAILGVKIKATKKINTDILVDCYCPGKETTILKKEAEVEKLISEGEFQTTLREIISSGENVPRFNGIYNVFAKPSVERTKALKDGALVSGHIDYFILYISDSEESPVYSTKKEVPFSCTVDAPGTEEGMACRIEAKAVHTSYNLNSAGEAEIRCVLSVSARVSVMNRIELIDDLEVVPLETESKKGIVIYFVQKNETLWDIAKRYYVSQNDILTVNNLDEDTILSEGMTLLIPTA